MFARTLRQITLSSCCHENITSNHLEYPLKCYEKHRYNQVMLAEARAHAAVQQANLNQLRYRTLEVKLAQTQKNLNNIITHMNSPREGGSVKEEDRSVQEEGPPRLRTQSMEWQLSSPRPSPAKKVSTRSPIKLLGGMPQLSSEIFDDFTELAELGLYEY